MIKKTRVNKEIELSLWDKLRGKSNIEEVELEIVEKEDNDSQLNQQMKQNIKERLSHYFPCYEFESVTVNRRGEIIKRTPKKARCFREDLGNGIHLDMTYIPGGTFLMGAPESEKNSWDNERPQHQVTIPPFWMGKYAVTQEQWQAIMGNNPSRFQGVKQPVEEVNWNDCQEFCRKLSQRTGKAYGLPSEAQWEYSCRAGTTTPFHFGETITTDLANYCGQFTYAETPKGVYRGETVEVGQFPPNAFGLYEMHGNVWEWCGDGWHYSYTGKPENIKNDGSIIWSNSDGRLFLLRGGSWRSDPRNCRSANRDRVNADNRDSYYGFRLAVSPS